MKGIISEDRARRAEPFQAVFHSETVRELTEKLKSIKFAALLLENGGAIAERANEALNLASRFVTTPLRTVHGRSPMRVQISEVPLEDYDGRDRFGQRIPGAPQRDDDPTDRGLKTRVPHLSRERVESLLRPVAEQLADERAAGKRAIRAAEPARDIDRGGRQAAERR